MRKWIIAGVVVLVLCAVVLVALLNVNSLVKRNKDYLLAQAEQALGRKLAVGDVELAIWNGIGVRLAHFTLSDDPAFSSADFVRARDLQVNVKLWPLLRKEVQVKRLILHEPIIQIIRNGKGEFNFSSIGKEAKEEKKKKEPVKEDAERGAESPAFLISLVDISDGRIRYQDRKENADLQVERIDLKVEDLDLDRPFSIQLAAALFAPQQNLKLNTRVGPLRQEKSATGVPLDGEITVDPLDMTKLKAALPKIKSSLPKELDLSGIYRVKGLKFKGTLEDLAINGELQGTEGAIVYGNSFQKPAGIPLVVSTNGRYAKSGISIAQGEIKLHTLALATKGTIRWGGPSALDLAFDSRPSALEGWDQLVPAIRSYELSGKAEIHATVRGKIGQGAVPQIQGTLSLADASARPPQFPKPIRDLNTKIHFTGQKAEIQETTLSLGNSRIRLAAAIERFAPLTLSYKISTPELLPADFQAGLAQERKADVLRNVSSDGQLRVQNGNVVFQGKLASADGTLYRIDYKGLAANLTLADKVANIRSLRANALDGALQVEGEYAFNTPVPRFSLASKVQGIDIQRLYTAIDPKAQRDVRGKLNADMKVFGSGQQWEQMKPTLRGQGEAEVLHGALMNFNIAESVLSGVTGVPGLTNIINPQVRKKYPETFEAKDTDFKELKANFDLANSRINIKNLRISAAEFLVQGNGWADFDHRVDFRSVLFFSQRLSTDLAGSAREVKYLFNNQGQLEIPFALTGTLPNVKPRPDTDLLARIVQRGFLQRGGEEIQRRLFGRKETAPPKEAAPAEPERTERPKRDSTEELIRKGLDQLFRR